MAGQGFSGDGNESCGQVPRMQPSSHAGGDSEGSSGFPGYQGEASNQGLMPKDPNEIRKQIETLERDLRSAQQVDDLQFKLDGLQSEMFGLEEKLKTIKTEQDNLEKVRSRLLQFGKLEGLPGDFENRANAFSQEKKRFGRDTERISEEIDRWKKKTEMGQQESLIKNKIFLIGLLGGLLSVLGGVAGFFFLGQLRYLALLDMVFFGVALVAVFGHLDRIMGAETGRSRMQLLQKRRKELKDKHASEAAMIEETLEKTGAESPEEVISLFAKKREVEAKVQSAEKKLAEQQKLIDQNSTQSKRDELQSQIDEIDSTLLGMSGMMMSPAEMTRRIAALKENLQQIESGSPPQVHGPTPAAEGFGLPEPGPVGQSTSQVFAKLLRLGEDLFLQDADRLNSSLSPRISQFVAVLSQNRFTQCILGIRGQIHLLGAGQKEPVAVAQLTPQDQDMVYLSMKFAFIEAFSKKQALPVFLDEPFVVFSKAQQDLLARLLAGVSRHCQVVLFTSNVEMTRHATASFGL
jgi:hypothetical protein